MSFVTIIIFFFFVNQIQFFRNCMIIDSRKINILIDITSI